MGSYAVFDLPPSIYEITISVPSFEEMKGGWATNDSIHPDERARSFAIFRNSITTGTSHEFAESLLASGYEVIDFGADDLDLDDDYPDYVVSMARAVAEGVVDRGIALCGSGVGASVAANKISGVRAGLIHDVFSAH